MGTAGPTETFFVVASTDLERAGIMNTRIREQLEKIPGLKEKGALTISAVPVDVQPAPGQSLEQQIQAAADCISGMVMSRLESNRSSRDGKQLAAESNRKNRRSN
jgi:hypothetical protein